MTLLQETKAEKLSQQDLFYAELRLKRMTADYLDYLHRGGSQYSCIGIALGKKMMDLSNLVNSQ